MRCNSVTGPVTGNSSIKGSTDLVPSLPEEGNRNGFRNVVLL